MPDSIPATCQAATGPESAGGGIGWPMSALAASVSESGQAVHGPNEVDRSILANVRFPPHLRRSSPTPIAAFMCSRP